MTAPVTRTHCSNDGEQVQQDVQESSGMKQKPEYFKYIKVHKTKRSSKFSVPLGGLTRYLQAEMPYLQAQMVYLLCMAKAK